MHLPKRVELWALLALVVAGLAWVFLSGRGNGDEEATGGAPPASEAQDPLRLHRCVLKRDHGNARLDVELRVRNDGGDTLVMQPPKVRLLGPNGREVPEFFLPFEPRPEVAAGSSQDVQLRYWLESSDLKGALNLDVEGKSLAIKGASPFDLNSVPEGEEKVVQPGGW